MYEVLPSRDLGSFDRIELGSVRSNQLKGFRLN